MGSKVQLLAHACTPHRHTDFALGSLLNQIFLALASMDHLHQRHLSSLSFSQGKNAAELEVVATVFDRLVR